MVVGLGWGVAVDALFRTLGRYFKLMLWKEEAGAKVSTLSVGLKLGWGGNRGGWGANFNLGPSILCSAAQHINQ